MNWSRVVTLPECYRILNVAPGVAWADVKRSYYTLAKQYHPDRNPGDVWCEERFKSISLAFRTLRQYYQAGGGAGSFRSTSARGSRVAWAYAQNAQWTGAAFGNEPPAADESRSNGGLPRLGYWSRRLWHTLRICERRLLLLDVEMRVTLSADMAQKGGGIKVRRGFETFEVRVPHGSYDGTVLRIPGKGDAGVLHRERGDLLIRIQVFPPQRSDLETAETYYQVTLSREAVLQRKVFTLETAQGPIQYSLPATCRHGQSFILRGRPDPFTGRRTRHVVTVLLA